MELLILGAQVVVIEVFRVTAFISCVIMGRRAEGAGYRLPFSACGMRKRYIHDDIITSVTAGAIEIKDIVTRGCIVCFR